MGISSSHDCFWTGVVLVNGFFFQMFRNWFLKKIGRKHVYPGIVSNYKEKQVYDLEGRIVSDVHAIVPVVLFPIAFFTTPEYYRDHQLYHPSLISIYIASWDLGYMIYDIFFLIKNRKNEKELLLMIIHHIITAICTYLVVFHRVCYLGCGILLMFETSTLFINNIFILPMVGLRDSILYKLNGVFALIAWAVFRLAIGIFYIRYITILAWDTYYTNSSWFMFLFFELTQIVFSLLNILWFYKLVMGFVKVLTGKKHEMDERLKKKE